MLSGVPEPYQLKTTWGHVGVMLDEAARGETSRMSWCRCAWCWGWRALRHDRNSDLASEIKEAAILVFASSSAPIKPATEGKGAGRAGWPAPLQGSVEIEHVEQIANSRHIYRYIRMVGIHVRVG